MLTSKSLMSLTLLQVSLSVNAMQMATAKPARCSIEVIEVGQGNCTFVAADGCCPILIDAGSRSSAYTDKSVKEFKTKQMALIIKRIREHAARVRINELILIVSHADTDHYGWLNDLMSNFIRGPLRIKQVILGCAEPYYSKEKFPNLLAALKQAQVPIVYPALTENTTQIQTIISTELFSCLLFPTKTCKAEKDTNVASLVIKITFGNIACLIMGDAEGPTTDHILSCLQFQAGGDNHLANVQLLLVAHHGASTDNSNKEEWIRRVNPHCVVMSSGIRADTHHPHREVVTRVKNNLSQRGIQKNEFHPLYSSDNGQRLAFQNRYGLEALREPIYGTLSQGTLVFTWGELDQELPVPTISMMNNALATKLSWPTERECLLTSLCKAPYTAFALIELTKLDLSGMALLDAHLDVEHNVSLLEKLRTHAKSLSILILSDNDLSTQRTLLLLRALYESQVAQLKDFRVLNNLFMDEDLTNIVRVHPALLHLITSKQRMRNQPPQAMNHPVAIPTLPQIAPQPVPTIINNAHASLRPIDMQAVFKAIKEGLSETVRLQLKGATKDNLSHQEGGMSLLHMAAWHNQAPVIGILVEFGAEVNGVNNSGSTPLHIAALAQNKEAIIALIKAGAQKHVRNLMGMLAYDCACILNNPAISVLLI